MQLDNAVMVDLTLTLAERYQPTWPGDVRFQTHLTAWFGGLSAGGVDVPAAGEHRTHAYG